MGETIDKNKYLDFDGLKKYDELVKKYISSVNDALSDNINSSLKGYVNENVDEIKEGISDLETIRTGAAAGAVAEQNAKEYADDLVKNEDGSVKFDDKGAAAQALADAKADAASLYQVKGNYEAAGTAAGLNAAMDERVVKLEAIDHDKIVADAIAAVVAGAESDFDTLKEVADWINSDTTGAAALQIKVAENADAITDLTNDKQDNITDLDTIRSGAAAGATALQAVPAEYVTESELTGKGYLTVNDLSFAVDSDIDALFA